MWPCNPTSINDVTGYQNPKSREEFGYLNNFSVVWNKNVSNSYHF